MNKLNSYSLFIGIIIYLIYEKLFYILFSINDILLFMFKFNNTIYLFGFIISTLFTICGVFIIYNDVVKKVFTNKLIVKYIFILIALALIFFSVNYMMGYIGKSSREMDKEVSIFMEYYEYRNIIYSINSILLAIVFLYQLRNTNDRQ